MSTTAIKVNTPSATPRTEPRTALALPCPRCGEQHAGIKVHLPSVGMGYEGKAGEFTCDDCEETFSVSDLQLIIRRWSPVLRWLAEAPQGEE